MAAQIFFLRRTRRVWVRRAVRPQAGEPGYAAQWLENPTRRIRLPRCTFADPGLEAAFQAAVAPGRRRLLTAGLGFNALAVALEWQMGGAGRDPSRQRDLIAELPWPEGEGVHPVELRVRHTPHAVVSRWAIDFTSLSHS
jgi:hypothetical protein